MLTKIHTTNAPQAIGPYSQAIIHNNMLYTSGQIALDPQTGILIDGDISAQTQRVLESLEAIVVTAGSQKENIIKCTIFLQDLNDFNACNRIYEKFFWTHKPARSTVQVARLPRDAAIEIECIAAI